MYDQKGELMDLFSDALHAWYLHHHRPLPWRRTRDPYLIWLSEAILQQTKVVQGLPYYERISERFPDIKSLAEASEDELLKYWEGLGYYSRARNLHIAAKSILKNHEGNFPSNYHDIRALKGVGDYTAAAVASIAYGLPYAAVDGNVIRVLSRYFGIDAPAGSSSGRNIVISLAQELLSREDPGMHNQAVMEFGALVCTPVKPACQTCPLASSCYACKNSVVDRLPAKSGAVVKQTIYYTFFLIDTGSGLLLEKRTGKGIWKNLYQLPMVETESLPEDDDILKMPEVIDLLGTPGSILEKISSPLHHILTHRIIRARFVHVKNHDLSPIWSKYLRVSNQEIYKFAFPVLIRNYLTRHKWL